MLKIHKYFHMLLGYEEIYRMPAEKKGKNDSDPKVQQSHQRTSAVQEMVRNGEIDLSKIK